jgi:hypothetical protein
MNGDFSYIQMAHYPLDDWRSIPGMDKDFLIVKAVARPEEDCSVVSRSYCGSFLWE